MKYEDIQDVVAAHPAFSGVVLVRETGQMVYGRGLGYANRADCIPNTLHTRFATASGTKTFTAVAVELTLRARVHWWWGGGLGVSWLRATGPGLKHEGSFESALPLATLSGGVSTGPRWAELRVGPRLEMSTASRSITVDGDTVVMLPVATAALVGELRVGG